MTRRKRNSLKDSIDKLFDGTFKRIILENVRDKEITNENAKHLFDIIDGKKKPTRDKTLRIG